jgi:hypothetical protein
VSDFLSNLIARSFADEPVIQPRVPSLFEPTATEFLDEPQPFTPTIAAATETIASPDVPPPVSRSSPMKRPSGQTEAIRKRSLETSKVIVPVDSSRDEGKDAEHKEHVSEASSKPRSIRSRGRKVFSLVEKPSPTSPPIIRVTIGRIEVRAVQSPTPTPKPAKPPLPKLSLQEYLHKRERGSR